MTKVVFGHLKLESSMDQYFIIRPFALGIGAASFASGGGAGFEQRYSGKPDGGAGTPKRIINLEHQNFRISLKLVDEIVHDKKH